MRVEFCFYGDKTVDEICVELDLLLVPNRLDFILYESFLTDEQQNKLINQCTSLDASSGIVAFRELLSDDKGVYYRCNIDCEEDSSLYKQVFTTNNGNNG